MVWLMLARTIFRLTRNAVTEKTSKKTEALFKTYEVNVPPRKEVMFNLCSFFILSPKIVLILLRIRLRRSETEGRERERETVCERAAKF